MEKYACKLFKAQSGAMSARLENKDGMTIHLHSLVRPEDECNYYDDLSIWGDRIILLGTGLGYHLYKIKDELTIKNKVIVVEYYKELADLCKKGLFPDADVITSETINPSVMLRQFIDGGEYIQVIKHPVSYNVNRGFYDDLQKNALNLKLQNATGNILLMYGNFFIQEEIRRAFNQNKLNVGIFDYRCIKTFDSYQNQLQKTIQMYKPEVIISINMLGVDGNGIWSDITSRYGIPVCVWYVDDPSPINLHQKQFIRSNAIAFCWERDYLEKLKEDGFESTFYLPLATDPDIFRQTEKELKTPVGFVGSAMNGDFLNNIKKKFLWKPSLDELTNEIAEELLKSPDLDVVKILEQKCKEQKLPFSDKRNLVWFRSLVIHTASMKKRKRIIEGLMENGIETFGDPSGWKTLCGNNIKTNENIDYHTGLAKVYQQIGVNVNITSCQMATSVNQRVFDIPACGGFVISDCQRDLEELFEPDEIVTYVSIEELKDKIQYYEQNVVSRKQISRRAYNRVINQHTYYHRCQEIYRKIKMKEI